MVEQDSHYLFTVTITIVSIMLIVFNGRSELSIMDKVWNGWIAFRWDNVQVALFFFLIKYINFKRVIIWIKVQWHFTPDSHKDSKVDTICYA